jgi:hypothetical protein
VILTRRQKLPKAASCSRPRRQSKANQEQQEGTESFLPVRAKTHLDLMKSKTRKKQKNAWRGSTALIALEHTCLYSLTHWWNHHSLRSN